LGWCPLETIETARAIAFGGELAPLNALDPMEFVRSSDIARHRSPAGKQAVASWKT